MSETKTSIFLSWDYSGRVQHKITGAEFPSPRDNRELWVLAPSAPFFVANQLGVLRPSYGLILCSQVMDISFNDKYLLSPINTALKDARIDFIYNNDGSVIVKFFPGHSLFYNSDSLEEGVRQLVANNFYCVLNHFDEYDQLPIKTSACAIIGSYYDFLLKAIITESVGPGRDQWNIEFSYWCAQVIHLASGKYSVPEPGQEDWVVDQKKFLQERLEKITDTHKFLIQKLGIR